MGEGRTTAVLRYLPVGYSEVDGMGRRKGYEMKTADAFGSDPSAHRPLTGSAENSIPARALRYVTYCRAFTRYAERETRQSATLLFQFKKAESSTRHTS